MIKFNLFDSQGHLNDEGIAFMAENMKADSLHAIDPVFSDHLENCIDCKQKILDTLQIIREIESEKRNSIRKGKTSKIYFYVAATILLMLGTGLLIRWKTNRIVFGPDKTKIVKVDKNDQEKHTQYMEITESSQNSEPQSKSKSVDTKKVILADNYKKSSQFEMLVNARYRSTGEIYIISPEMGQEFTFKSSVLFKWKTEVEKDFILKIYTNKSLEPIQICDKVTNPYILDTILDKGLYYWKLETKEDLFFVGKFYVY